MKRIIIIGCPGSGKTTLALSLHKITGLPLYHLDTIWHKPDRTHISREEFDVRLADILACDEWIIDGNYSRTVEVRLVACDTIILFDLPTEVALRGAISRLGKPRSDMPWCDASLDPLLRTEIEEFSSKNLPTLYTLIEKYKHEKNVIILKSHAEASRFLETLNVAR